MAQSVKAYKQSAISGGAWTSAWKLTGEEDPFQEKKFAGTHRELAVIGGFNKGLAAIEATWQSAESQKEKDKEKEKEKERPTKGAGKNTDA